MATNYNESSEKMQAEITSKIVSKMMDGEFRDWVKPWVSTGLARNLQTKKYYSGINQLILCWLSHDMDVPNLWAGFNQIKQAGGTVKRGNKSFARVIYPLIKKYDKDVTDKSGNTTTEKRTYLKGFADSAIFNITQTDLNIDDFLYTNPNNKPIERAHDFIGKIDHVIEHGNTRAYYSVTDDKIVMPEMKLFTNSENYYFTYLHELTHWSGADNRLQRIKKIKSDIVSFFSYNEDYAYEELVAEFGSAFMSAHLGLDGTDSQHESYMASWIKMLNEDYTLAFKASNQAFKAFAYLCDLAGEPVTT